MITTKNATPARVIELRKRKALLQRAWNSFLGRIVLFVALLVVFFTFVLGVYRADANDMFPSVKEGDYAIFLRIGLSAYRNNDVIVYRKGNNTYIGRIQATSGDMLDKSGGQLTINAQIMPKQPDAGLYYKTLAGDSEYPITLSEKEYFVIGDKRNTAVDSRTVGVIKQSDIRGKVFLVLRSRNI